MSDSNQNQSIITIAAPEEKYQIIKHKSPNGSPIHISTWDTERRARNEAKKFERKKEDQDYYRKIVVDGKFKYAVLLGFFSSEEESFSCFP